MNSSVSIYRLVKNVLDQTYRDIPGEEHERDKTIGNCIESLSDYFKALSGGLESRYSGDPALQFAYVYRNMTLHAHLVSWLIGQSKSLVEVMGQPMKRIACVGGGPGTDALGVAHWLYTQGLPLNFRCTILDREITWSDLWYDVEDQLKAFGYVGRSAYQPLDMLCPKRIKGYRRLFASDVVTMTYLASEIFPQAHWSTSCLTQLATGLSDGAFLIYIDRNDPDLTKWVDDIFREAEFDTYFRMDITEDKDFPWLGKDTDLVLADNPRNRIRFGREPRSKANITCRIFRKDKIDWKEERIKEEARLLQDPASW